MFEYLEPYTVAVVASAVTAGVSVTLGYLMGRRECNILSMNLDTQKRRAELAEADILAKHLEIQQFHAKAHDAKITILVKLNELMRVLKTTNVDLAEVHERIKGESDQDIKKAYAQCQDLAERQRHSSQFAYRKTSRKEFENA